MVFFHTLNTPWIRPPSNGQGTGIFPTGLGANPVTICQKSSAKIGWGVRPRAVEGGAKLTEAMIFMPPPVFWATQKKMLTLAPHGVAGDVLGWNKVRRNMPYRCSSWLQSDGGGVRAIAGEKPREEEWSGKSCGRRNFSVKVLQWVSEVSIYWRIYIFLLLKINKKMAW